MPKYDKDELRKLILEDQLSYEEVGRIHGVSGVAIKKATLRLGLELPKRCNINASETFNKGTIRSEINNCAECDTEFIVYSEKRSNCCSIECYNIQQHKKRYQKIIDGDPEIMRANYKPDSFKVDIMNEQNHLCILCNGEPYHNGKPMIFILDHIDGDASNNKRDNLRMVCPNCDSQLPTYKFKNKNSARHYHRYGKEKIPKP